MKTIILTESQFKRLCESETVEFLGGDTKEFNPSEISTTTIIDNEDGDEEYGDDVFTDDVSKFLTHQVFGSCDGFCRR
jgi:hypothetical protein